MGRIAGDSVAAGVWQLDEMRDHHREMARLLLAGWRPGEIAKHFGMTNATISIIINSPCFREHVDRMQAEADGNAVQTRVALNDEVARLSQKAIDVMKSFLEDEHGNTKQAISPDMMKLQVVVAKDMLDRAGFKAANVLKIENNEQDNSKKKELNSIYNELVKGGDADGTGDDEQDVH